MKALFMKGKKMSNENNDVELFKQCYMAARAVETAEGKYRLDFSVLGEDTHSWTFEDELEAKAAYKVLEEFYLQALKNVQKQVVEIHDQQIDAPYYDPTSPSLSANDKQDKQSK